MRLIDADEMLLNESEAYMNAQTTLARKGKNLTWMVNQVVHAEIQKLINDTPTIVAEPVRHGRWKETSEEEPCYYYCSECGGACNDEWNYCPNCGARMEELE